MRTTYHAQQVALRKLFRQGTLSTLDDTIRQHIDTAVNRIVSLCREHGYTHVHYSAKEDGSLGTAIFTPDPSVTAYILKSLKEHFSS